MECFLKYLRAIDKIESDFTREIKGKSNWQIVR